MFDWIPTRITVAMLTMLGLMNVLMVRVNLSVAIVAMVRHNLTSIDHVKAQCDDHSNSPTQHRNYSDTDVTLSAEALPTTSDERPGGNSTGLPVMLADPDGGGDMEGELDWDEMTQGLVLGAFFYGYWITQVIGGRLAEVYGTRIVFGVCVLSGGVSSVLTPVAARTHYGVLFALRMVQGLFQGCALPCIFPFMVNWFPPFERSRFIAYILFCNNISITLTLPLCGVVIHALGWPAAFYVTGLLSFAWCVLWFIFVHDTPAKHPRISPEEVHYIHHGSRLQKGAAEVVVGDGRVYCQTTKPSTTTTTTSAAIIKSVPWLQMARSLPLWAVIVGEVGNSFGFSVYFSYIPTYMKNILGYSIKQNGFLSALPFLCRYLGAVVAATLGEYLILHRVLSVVTTRRIFSAVAMFGPAVNMLVVSFSGCQPVVVIVLLCLGFFFNGSITIGLFANRVDLSSNYAGTLSGFANGSANIMAFIVPLSVGALIQNQQTMGQWQKVFWMCVPVYVLTELFFLLFVSAARQSWDTYVEDAELKDQEEEEEEEEEEEGEVEKLQE